MTVNTSFLGSGLTQQITGSDVSIAGALFVAGAQNMTGAVGMSSTLSVRGITTLHAALNSGSAISGAAITGTTGTFGTSATIGGGTAVTKISSSTIGVVALTLTAETSTTTTATFSGATTVGTPQAFVVTPQSALSAGVSVFAYPTSTNQITLSYSNMTIQQALAPHTVRVVMFQF